MFASCLQLFDHVSPVWELRVGDYRVFYDINEAIMRVFIRAVRFKGPEQTTAEITT
jgi:mRNA-degrading endonuclease RelE of RelBE toxin-antitoxin system